MKYKFEIIYNVIHEFSTESDSEEDAKKEAINWANKLTNLYPNCKNITIKKI